MSARSTSENCGPSASSRATRSSSTASRASPSCSARPGLAGEGAHLELGRSGGADVAPGRGEELGRLRVAVRLGERLGAGEQRLDPAAQVGRDAAAEERRVDAELRREPRDRLGGRARLAALDLADVLLREAIARDLGLRQAGSEAQRAQPLAEPRGRRGRRRRGRRRDGDCTSFGSGRSVAASIWCVSQGDSPSPSHSSKRVRSAAQAWDLRVK